MKKYLVLISVMLCSAGIVMSNNGEAWRSDAVVEALKANNFEGASSLLNESDFSPSKSLIRILKQNPAGPLIRAAAKNDYLDTVRFLLRHKIISAGDALTLLVVGTRSGKFDPIVLRRIIETLLARASLRFCEQNYLIHINAPTKCRNDR